MNQGQVGTVRTTSVQLEALHILCVLHDLTFSLETRINLQLGSVQTQMQSKGGFGDHQVPSNLTPSGKPVVSYTRAMGCLDLLVHIVMTMHGNKNLSNSHWWYLVI